MTSWTGFCFGKELGRSWEDKDLQRKWSQRLENSTDRVCGQFIPFHHTTTRDISTSPIFTHHPLHSLHRQHQTTTSRIPSQQLHKKNQNGNVQHSKSVPNSSHRKPSRPSFVSHLETSTHWHSWDLHHGCFVYTLFRLFFLLFLSLPFLSAWCLLYVHICAIHIIAW